MKLISDSNQIVIKIGSHQVVDPKSGSFQTTWLNNIIDEICALKDQGKRVILVASGGIPLACNLLGIAINSKMKLLDKQTLSVIGQFELLKRYKESFSRYNINIAQILLTIEDVENRKKYNTARNVINNLLDRNIVPIINENDAIANTELRFGDNDRLSARVAQISNSDLLILLANVDGLFTADPSLDKSACFIKEVYEISPEIEKFSGDSIRGTGGMSAKIAAAKIAMNANIKCVIANSAANNILKNLDEDKVRYTMFAHDDSVHVKFIKE